MGPLQAPSAPTTSKAANANFRVCFIVCSLTSGEVNEKRGRGPPAGPRPGWPVAPLRRGWASEPGADRVKRLRVHVAGDFFGIAYIRAWTRIARACQRATFVFYTRSWRRPEMREPLIELASLPNIQAFWSEDRDSGPSDLPVGRRCFLIVDPEDGALVPPGLLVFRSDDRTPLKWVNGSWVCPKEQGTGAGITCSACRWCFKPGPLPVPPDQRDAARIGSAPAAGMRVGRLA